MWIGPIPWQLQGLTFPEQLLLAQLYPRVYVFKLFPKKVYGRRDASTLQRGMRGNVTTFELDNPGIASMLKGNLMPRPPAILASIITVTFVGLGELPKSWLHNTFRVRRHVVANALKCLIDCNKKYYGHLELSPERLEALPEDGVPDEIMNVIRQTDDASAPDEEGAASYVPTEEDVTVEQTESTPVTEKAAPDVIPLQISGTIDTDHTKLTGNDLMKWGLLNLWQTSDEGAYAIRHGAQPVNDFGRPRRGEDDGRHNFFERAYPMLFPFGRGGIEADRPNPVDFTDHIRWALRYHDGRFRRHETFPFTAFGIQQRRQGLGAARLQTRRRNFDRDVEILSTITAEKLQHAQKQEERGERVTDPAVQLLKSHIHATAGKVVGSNASKHRLKSQIWSTSIALGPPSLWITINPCDLHDPIAQIFAGEKIDLDDFLATQGPDAHQRAQNIAQDPYAAAKFFHFLIHAILTTLFGVTTTKHRVHSEKGIFGYVSAYFGVVESQGRGSLHFHLLVWLLHAPTLAEMQDLLRTEEFREKVRNYIRANVRAYTPGMDSHESVKAIPNEVEIAYSRPPNPFDDVEYEQHCQNFEKRVARAKQVHTCELRRCLRVDGNGKLVCKRRAPFETSDKDYVLENGHWCQERRWAYMNGWCPEFCICVRCNNDIKVLLNGKETVNISYYVTGYSAKNQQKNHNISAVVAQNLAYHVEHSSYLETLKDQQRLLLFRIVNAINREQELAAPMVISFLMGWGDLYVSHRYASVYWSSFTSNLIKQFPDLIQAKQE
ncbi:hypothetical protein BDZ89DRAFT_1210221 [Hymenopellis radicata]|nr:hypothetical protein BDZ89DRAFT_1210221 [Hymenopellis radicata]